jgi:N-acetylneuraminic acid mutarotase
MAAFGDHVVLFGGYGNAVTDGVLSDMWTWNGASWTKEEVQTPKARSEAVMTAVSGSLVLYGGYSNPGVPLADTWTWNGTMWSEVATSGPSARAGAAMATE